MNLLFKMEDLPRPRENALVLRVRERESRFERLDGSGWLPLRECHPPHVIHGWLWWMGGGG